MEGFASGSNAAAAADAATAAGTPQVATATQQPTPSGLRIPSPEEYWALSAQVMSLQSALNGTTTNIMEVLNRATRAEVTLQGEMNVANTKLDKMSVDVQDKLRQQERSMEEQMRKHEEAMDELKASLDAGMNAAKLEIADLRRAAASAAPSTTGDPSGSGAGKSYRKHRDPKPFVPPSKGAEAQFRNWAFVFVGHMEHLRPGMEDFLEWAQRHEEEITEDKLREYEQDHGFEAISASQLLYDELRGLFLEGEPQTLVRNARAGKRGADCWRKVSFRYDPKGALVAQGISEQLQSLEWPKTTSAVYEMLEGIDNSTLR